jgi:hypothetical protein
MVQALVLNKYFFNLGANKWVAERSAGYVTAWEDKGELENRKIARKTKL